MEKINKILSDDSKFKFVCTKTENNNTGKIEKLQIQLPELTKKDELPQSVHKVIRPTGAQRPRMNGLPKIYKKNTPLHPILSMTTSAQHKLAKYMYLSLFLTCFEFIFYSTNCVKNSFTFARTTRDVNSKSTFLCLFDISSLFTNVPLDEIINIYAEALYNSFFMDTLSKLNSTDFSTSVNSATQICGIQL